MTSQWIAVVRGDACPSHRYTCRLSIISYVSDFTRREPGDVISTGTPPGVGLARKPPLWLKAGDAVEVEISGIGVLRNPVVDELR